MWKPKLKEKFRELKKTISTYKLLDFQQPKRCVVVRFEPFLPGCGLTDRIRHIISVYLISEKIGIPFRIYHTKPFNIEDALHPASYDWRLRPGELSTSFWKTNRIKTYSYFKSKDICEEEEATEMLDILVKAFSNAGQHHVYGNAHIMKEKWAYAFYRLFKPSPTLQKMISSLELPKSYKAVTLRFQNLLGDFKESYFNPLPPEEAQALIESCISKIEELKLLGKLGEDKILLTSDSVHFLQEAKSRLPYVITIPGNMAHFSQHGYNSETYLKSFIDLYALSKATSITLLKTGKMYNSGFPEFASILGNTPYKTLSF